MKEKQRKKELQSKAAALLVILGFTFALMAVGCAAGELLGMKAADIAGCGGFLGLAGFFIGVLFLMQKDRVK